MVIAAFPGNRVVSVQPLTDGLRNANFRIGLDSPAGSIVLRIYEQDPSLCRKEIDLMRLVAATLPVPEVIHAEPFVFEDIPPFILMRFIEGISFRALRRSGSQDAIAQAAFSAGETLAALGGITFPRPGWLAAGPAVTGPLMEGTDPIPRFVDACLAHGNLQRRMPPGLRDRTRDLVWSSAAEIAAFDEARLTHGDFNQRNILVRQVNGRWKVVAVLDWEFAVAGSPLMDIGNFLRYELRPRAEPHFSAGFSHGGGTLPQDWRRLARLIDLTALCASLTQDELPAAVSAELIELVHATVEDRAPRLA